MTSQLVLMNSSGISVSSDSAVTVGGRKTFNSVNKIIELKPSEDSTPHRIAFLISGSANFISSGQSWSHIIWRFQKECLGNEKTIPESVEDYANKFRDFIQKSKLHNGHKLNDEALAYGICKGICQYIKTVSPFVDVDANGDNFLPGGPTDEQLINFNEIKTQSLVSLVESLYEMMPDELKDTESWNRHLLRIAKNVHEQVSEEIEGFEKITISNDFVNAVLNELMGNKMSPFKKFFWESGVKQLKSTVCIMGYGSKDFYPTLVRLEIAPELSDKPKQFITKTQRFTISPDNTESTGKNGEDGYSSKRQSFILPFAQKVQMQTLINGVNHEFRMEVLMKMYSKMQELPKKLANILFNLPGFGEKTTSKALMAIAPQILEELKPIAADSFSEEVIQRRSKMRSSVASLPLKEMNEFSQLLVEIESKIKYYTEETRSVGGDVDVAQITLESGFEWVKRK